MKTYKEISENLAILGIFSEDQLDKHNLDYWWRKKYTQIFESNLEDKNELLINLNNAKDNLNFEESLFTCKYVLKKIKNAETETVLRQDNAGINKTNGNYEKEILQFSKIIAKNPYNNIGYKERGRLKKIKDIDSFKKDLKIADILKTSLSINKIKGKSKKIELLNKLIEVDSENIFFLEDRAEYLTQIRDYDLAILDYKRLTKINPKKWEYFYKRGLIFVILGKNSLALKEFSNAISINPNKLILYSFRGKLYRKNKNYNAAIKDQLLLLTKMKTNEEKAPKILELAKLEIEKNSESKDIKSYQKALEYSDQLTSLEPDKSRGYACKCIIYTKCNLPQEKFKADIHKNLVYHASDHGESEEILGEFLNNKEIDRIFNTELRTSIYKQYPIHKKTSWWDWLVEFWFAIFLIIIVILIYF